MGRPAGWILPVALDVSLIQRIAEPVIIGVLLTLALRLIERRVRLSVFYGHVGEFRTQPSGNIPAFVVHTHSVVIRNSGKLAAHNVRVPHAVSLGAPNVNVSVNRGVNFTQSTLQSGSDELLFPILVPGQQVTISYLYYPPLIWSQINLPVTCDEGMARVLNVLPTPQLRPWQLWLLRVLVIIGAITVLLLVAYVAHSALGAWKT
jgi:hypothetical protein